MFLPVFCVVLTKCLDYKIDHKVKNLGFAIFFVLVSFYCIGIYVFLGSDSIFGVSIFDKMKGLKFQVISLLLSSFYVFFIWLSLKFYFAD